MIDSEPLSGSPDPEVTRIEESPGLPIVLADGRAWHLASPQFRSRPRSRGTRPTDSSVHGRPLERTTLRNRYR